MSLYNEIINNYIAKPEQRPEPVQNVATEVASIPAQSSVPASSIPKMEQYSPIFSQGGGAIESMYKLLHQDQEPESSEGTEKREEREKRNSNLMSLVDGLSGIANVWGAMKGAAPIKQESLSQANRYRYEYAKKEREANKDAWRRGVFNSRLQDISNRQAAEQAKLAAAEKERQFQYKAYQDKLKNDQWEKRFAFDADQATFKNDMEAKKFEELQKKNAADLKIRQRAVAVAEKNAQTALTKVHNAAGGKVVRFGLSDGTNITVPNDLKGSYVADVYNRLVGAAGGANIDSKGQSSNPILSFMKYHYGQKEPGLSEMMTAIQLYKDKYPGIEDYMTERAGQYTDNYSTPVAKDMPAPGSPGISKVPINMQVLAPKWGTQQTSSNNQPLSDDDLLEFLIE